jgi:acyl-CoA thioester hydrolase
MVRGCVPRVFRWSAPVWQADVDAFGELRTSTLLKFLQETATRASTDAGFDPAYYVRTGTMWLVRRTTLELEHAVRYGDTLEATTWIADFRRVRSQRRYEVSAGERSVARATTDWVYVDAVRSRPRTIPLEMERVFVPEGTSSIARVAMPAADPPIGATILSHRVAPYELDALAHVNNAHYVHYVEHAALETAGAAGWSIDRQRAAGGRLRALRHDLEYLDGGLLGEELTIASWPTAVADERLELTTLVTRARDAAPLLRAVSAYGWVDGDRRPARLPDALRDAFAAASSARA